MSEPQAPAAAEPSAVKLAGTMAFAGLVAGVALVLAYEYTLPTIRANNARALEEAVKKVVPGSTRMQKLVLSNGAAVPAPPGDEGPGVYAAYDDQGTFRGYAIPAEGAGFQDVIRLIYGFDPDKRALTGMNVLESRETPGLGDKIYKDAKFVAQFDGLSVDPEVVATKASKDAPNEIDVITGATISSKAIVKIVNGANGQWTKVLPKGANAPAAPAPGPVARSEEPAP